MISYYILEVKIRSSYNFCRGYNNTIKLIQFFSQNLEKTFPLGTDHYFPGGGDRDF